MANATYGWWTNRSIQDSDRIIGGRGEPRLFHRTAPGYAETRLVDLPALAAELGVGRLLVKEESVRLGLPSFKVLGASWAIANVMARRTGHAGDITWPLLESLSDTQSFTLVTATDGNHGRAVAWMGRQLDLAAHIVVPAAISEASAAAIAGEGATVERIDGDYDDAVARAVDAAADLPDAELVQDMAWEGYEEVPGWIVDGYGTLLSEIDDELERPADLVVVPVGVGSLAQSVVSHYSGTSTAVMGVEPVSAACLLASLENGEMTTVPAAPTVMAGLYCASLSATAWPVLSKGLAATITVDDQSAIEASGELLAEGVSSGPSGAASLAGARIAFTGKAIGDIGLDHRRGALGLDDESVVVLLSTEAHQDLEVDS